MSTSFCQSMDVSMMSTRSTRPGDLADKRRLNILEDNEVDRGDGDTVFKNLVETTHVDFHAALSNLSQDPQSNIWVSLSDITEDLHKALAILLDTNRENTEIKSAVRHVYSEQRAYELVIIVDTLQEEFSQYKDVSHLANLICTDREFRLLYSLWRWCQAGACSDPRGFSDLVTEYNGLSTVRNIRSGSVRAMSVGKKGLGVDLDSACTPEDNEAEDRLVRTVFSLVRCGKLDEAISLVCSVGMPVLATPLHMYNFLSDPSMSPTDCLHDNYDIAKRRTVFLTTMKKIVDKSTVSPFTRMLWSSLCGMLDPIYSMATTSEDRLWCLVNAAVHQRLQEACFPSNSADDIPITVESIFGEIVAEEKSPYFPIYGLLLREEWAELIDWFTTLLKQSVDDQLIRFMANVVTIARIKSLEHDEESGLSLISAMMSGLSAKGLFSLIPFYATFLPRPEAEQTLLQIMHGVKGESVRLEYLSALEVAGFDRDTLAILSAEHHEEHDMSSPERIDRLGWLLLNGERTMDQTIVQTNNLIRFFMVADDMESASRVLNETMALSAIISAVFESENGDSPISVSEETLSQMAEYECHQQFFDTFSCCQKLADQAVQLKAYGEERPAKSAVSSETAVGLTEITERAVEERQRDNEMRRKQTNIDIHKHKALEGCMKLLNHPGWRFCSSAEQLRSDQLSRMRDMCYTSVLELTIGSCHAVNDDDSLLDLAVMLAEEGLCIQKFFSKESLRHIMGLIHSYAGHLLSEMS